MSNEEVYRDLRKFNGAMGVFHLFQAIIMLILSNDFSLPIKYTYPAFNTTTQSIYSVTESLIDVRIGPMVALF